MEQFEWKVGTTGEGSGTNRSSFTVSVLESKVRSFSRMCELTLTPSRATLVPNVRCVPSSCASPVLREAFTMAEPKPSPIAPPVSVATVSSRDRLDTVVSARPSSSGKVMLRRAV